MGRNTICGFLLQREARSLTGDKPGSGVPTKELPLSILFYHDRSVDRHIRPSRRLS